LRICIQLRKGGRGKGHCALISGKKRGSDSPPRESLYIIYGQLLGGGSLKKDYVKKALSLIRTKVEGTRTKRETVPDEQSLDQIENF